MKRAILLKLEDELLARVDLDRGSEARTVWLRKAIEAKLGSRPVMLTEGPSSTTTTFTDVAPIVLTSPPILPAKPGFTLGPVMKIPSLCSTPGHKRAKLYHGRCPDCSAKP